MPYELQAKPFVRKDGWKYKLIQITDIALHTSHKQPTLSIGKKVSQSFRSSKPGRIYGSLDNATLPDENKLALIDLIKKDPEFLKLVQEEERNGYKVLLALPHELPIVAGRDTIEFMTSVNGKRMLRKLAKNNPNN